MSLLEEYRGTLIRPGDGSVNPEIQRKKRFSSPQMKLYYTPKDYPEPKPKTSELRGGMPDSILKSRLSHPFRRILHDPNNIRFWNRIARRSG